MNAASERRLLVAIVGVGLVAAAVAAGGAGARSASSRAAVVALRPGVQPPPSLFGINTGTYDTSEARLSRDLPAAKRLGARWVHFTGDSIKYSRGRLSFALMDSEVDRARSLGLGVVISLGGIRGACSTKPAPRNPTSCPPTSARDLAVYAAYLRTLLRHFAGRVRYYESWVEPNHTSMWAGGVNPGQYAAVLETEYSVFRASAPREQLMFAGVADFGIADGSPNGVAVLPFTDQVLADLHGRAAFDLVALHAYRFPPSLAPDDAAYTHYPVSPVWRKDTWTQQLQAYQQEFTTHGYGAPRIWLTEFGWPGNRQPGTDYFPSLPAQATDVAQAYRALESPPCRSCRRRSGSTSATTSRARPTRTQGSSATTACCSTTSPRSRRRPSLRALRERRALTANRPGLARPTDGSTVRPVPTYTPQVSAEREAFVQEAELMLADDADPRAPGAAVTAALCGFWEHEGPCRWPHNNAITATGGGTARFRTLFVADGAEEQAVRDLIAGALADAAGWSVTSSALRPVAASERDLARRLLTTRVVHAP